MVEFFKQGGSMMWLLLILAAVIFVLAVITVIELLRRKNLNSSFETRLNSILFWGAISAMIGIFGHFTGIYNAMLEVLKIKDTSPAIVGSEYLMSFANIMFGLFIFIIASVVWFTLRWRYKKLL